MPATSTANATAVPCGHDRPPLARPAHAGLDLPTGEQAPPRRPPRPADARSAAAPVVPRPGAIDDAESGEVGEARLREAEGVRIMTVHRARDRVPVDLAGHHRQRDAAAPAALVDANHLCAGCASPAVPRRSRAPRRREARREEAIVLYVASTRPRPPSSRRRRRAARRFVGARSRNPSRCRPARARAPSAVARPVEPQLNARRPTEGAHRAGFTAGAGDNRPSGVLRPSPDVEPSVGLRSLLTADEGEVRPAGHPSDEGWRPPRRASASHPSVRILRPRRRCDRVGRREAAADASSSSASTSASDRTGSASSARPRRPGERRLRGRQRR